MNQSVLMSFAKLAGDSNKRRFLYSLALLLELTADDIMIIITRVDINK